MACNCKSNINATTPKKQVVKPNSKKEIITSAQKPERSVLRRVIRRTF